MAAMACWSAQAQAVKPVKMVIGPDGRACEYIGETADKYHVMCQDDGWVDKKTHRIEIWSPEKGKGWVCCRKADGKVNIYKSADAKSAVVGQLTNTKGYIPESAACLGLEKGWYKVNKDGVVGYVKTRTAWWSAKSLD